MWAIIRFDFEGFHKWGDAPDAQMFLRYPHRHLFKCEVWIEEIHDNRDVEYMKWRKLFKETFKDGMDVGSCEMTAEQIIAFIRVIYKDRSLKAFVYEDGENGSCVEFNP